MKNKAVWLIALGLALVVAQGAPVIAQTPPPAKTISIATLAPPGSTWMRVFDAWNREIRRRSNGTLQMRFYPGGVQGDESEVIRKIKSGRLDGAAVTAVGLAQIYKPALVFQLPGILNTYDQLDHARAALQGDMDSGFTGAGFKLLGWADVGQSRLYSTAAIHVPADLANRHPWAWRDDSILPTLYGAIHTNPVSLGLPEVLAALQTGRVDTFVTTPVACVALQWCSKVSFMIDHPLTIVVGGTVIGKPQWDALTPEQQQILSETGEQFHTLARRNLRHDEITALASTHERGITFTTVTPAQIAEWTRLGTMVRTRLTGQIADQALIDRVATFGH